MPSELNRLKAISSIAALRLQDAVAAARRLKLPNTPPSWPSLPDPRGIDKAGLQRLLAQFDRSRPDHPANWHRRAVEDALAQPRARDIYFTIRRNLWTWPEFLSLNEKARLMLEIVIELAREEAFPWYVCVKAREVMKLARTNHATMAAALRELQCLAIARPARRIALVQHIPDEELANPHALGLRSEISRRAKAAAKADLANPVAIQRGLQQPRWPSPENHWGVDPDQPLENIPQWVIRYRHGAPRNAGRAAWWINYDLLCGTHRVLPGFEVKLDTLAKTYERRNHRLGTSASLADEEGFAAMERVFARRGPLPKGGFRAALWEGM